jgi:hypothetical protein
VKIRGDRELPLPTPQDEPRERRLFAVGACRAWTEIDRFELVERERGYLVNAETDEAFSVIAAMRSHRRAWSSRT